MSEVATRVILVRHGAVENPEDVIYGRLPGFHLSEEGRAQVEELAEILKSRGIVFDTLYTGPLARACETAVILKENNGVLKTGRFDQKGKVTEIRVRQELNDVESPILEGQPMSVISEIGFGYYLPKYADWRIEPPEKQRERTRRLANEVVENCKGETVGFVGHGDPLRFCLGDFPGASIVDLSNLRDSNYLGPAEAVMLNFDGEGKFIDFEYIRRSGSAIETKASEKFKEAT